jgi:hypothetical protein
MLLLPAAADLLDPLTAAFNTISAALEQQQQQGALKQQQQQSLDIMMRLGFYLLQVWHREVQARTAAEQRAAAAALDFSRQTTFRYEEVTETLAGIIARNGWLVTDPAVYNSAIVPAVARLVLSLTRTFGYSDCHSSSSSSSSSATDRASGVLRVPTVLLRLPISRQEQLSLVARVAETIVSAVGCTSLRNPDVTMQVHRLMNEPHVLQLLLLDLGLSLNATHQQLQGKAALPDTAAAVAAALQQSASDQQQQQQVALGKVPAWHEQLLLRLGVPAAELAAAAEAALGSFDSPLRCGKPVVALTLALVPLPGPEDLPLDSEQMEKLQHPQQQQQQKQQEELEASSCGSSSSSCDESGSSIDVNSIFDRAEFQVMLPDNLQLPLLWSLLEVLLLLDVNQIECARLLAYVVNVMVQTARDAGLAQLDLHSWTKATEEGDGDNDSDSYSDNDSDRDSADAATDGAALGANAAARPASAAAAEGPVRGDTDTPAGIAAVNEVSALLSAVLQLHPVFFTAVQTHSNMPGWSEAAEYDRPDTALVCSFVEVVCQLRGFPGLPDGERELTKLVTI